MAVKIFWKEGLFGEKNHCDKVWGKDDGVPRRLDNIMEWKVIRKRPNSKERWAVADGATWKIGD